MITTTDLGINGAKRTSYHHANLRELCLKVQKENGGITDRDQLRDLLIIAVKQAADDGEPGYIEACIEYGCSRTVNNTIKELERPSYTERKQQEATATAVVQTKLKEVVERRAQQIILDTIMPNGKMMRDVTGTYLAKVNAGFAKIAKIAGSRKIGDVIDEKKARQLLK